MVVELMDENPTQARNDNLGAEYTAAISDRAEIAPVPASPAVERNVRRLQLMTIPSSKFAQIGLARSKTNQGRTLIEL
jgi:hypothetical protein